jgi:hypothetical protein
MKGAMSVISKETQLELQKDFLMGALMGEPLGAVWEELLELLKGVA